jgi:hypothetical protein
MRPAEALALCVLAMLLGAGVTHYVLVLLGK